jgi:prefoldin subunit 5
VLEIDWQLAMSKSGVRDELAAMQAAIAAIERAQAELRTADALVTSASLPTAC